MSERLGCRSTAQQPGRVECRARKDTVDAARKLRRSIDGLTRVVAIELMTATRGLALRTTTGETAGSSPAPATGAVVRLLQQHGVGAPGPDRFLSPEIETAVELVASGAVLSAVEAEIGELA